ncbi:MAG: YaaC family protein [Commensalibacter sp.]|nr:YaaC family protein [Commensalibacter sp.]
MDCIGNNNNFSIEIDPEIFKTHYEKIKAEESKALPFSVNFPETNFLKKGNYLITLDDLLSRDSRLDHIYVSTLYDRKNRISKCLFTKLDISKEYNEDCSLNCGFDVRFIVDIINGDKAIKSLGRLFLNPTKDEIAEMAWLKRKIPLGDEFFDTAKHNDNFENNFSSLPAIQTLDINSYPIEYYKYKQRYTQFAIFNFNNGDSFSLLHITYMTAYLLGMIARYHPYQWSSLLRGEKGNPGQPAILQAIQNIERDFPVLINSALEAKRLEKMFGKPSIVKWH